MSIDYYFGEDTIPYTFCPAEKSDIIAALAVIFVDLYQPVKKNEEGKRVRFISDKEHSILFNSFYSFLCDQDLEDLCKVYEDELKEYFEEEAYEQYKEVVASLY